MESTAFFQYITTPSLLNKNSEENLLELCKKYPYSTTLQLLYTKNLQNTENIFLNEQLKIAAAYSTNRTSLYELLHQPKSKPILEEKNVLVQTEKLPDAEEPSALKSSENKNLELNLNTTNTEEFTKTETKNEIDILEKQYIQEVLSNNIYNIEQTTEEIENDTTNPAINTNTQLSFIDWLKTIDKKEIKQKKNNPVIELMINRLENIEFTEPSQKAKFFSPSEMAKKSVQEDEELITETLAHIHYLQGNYSKALNAYKKLSLKYPEKKSYFATQIKLIKEKIK
jgi:hypothetical protein